MPEEPRDKGGRPQLWGVPTIRKTVRLPRPLIEDLEAEAFFRGTSLSHHIIFCLLKRPEDMRRKPPKMIKRDDMEA